MLCKTLTSLTFSFIIISCSSTTTQSDNNYPYANSNDSTEYIKNQELQNREDVVNALLDLEKSSDSLQKAAELSKPVSCTYEFGEDINFNQYVSITLLNNTKEVIKSVQLNIQYASYGNGSENEKNEQINKQLVIKPGQRKTFRYSTDYNISKISVVKYFGSKSGATHNGFDAFVEETNRKVNEQYPYLGQ